MDRTFMNLKTVGKAMTTAFCVIAACLALLMAGARLAGLQPYAVLSKSMKPAYAPGALIYVGKIEPHGIRPGMAITFRLKDQSIVTHRVTRVEPDPEDPSRLWFATKGDANHAEDETMIHSSQVIGVPIFRLPLLGYPAKLLDTAKGKQIALALTASAVAGGSLWYTKKKQGIKNTKGPQRAKAPSCVQTKSMVS